MEGEVSVVLRAGVGGGALDLLVVGFGAVVISRVGVRQGRRGVLGCRYACVGVCLWRLFGGLHRGVGRGKGDRARMCSGLLPGVGSVFVLLDAPTIDLTRLTTHHPTHTRAQTFLSQPMLLEVACPVNVCGESWRSTLYVHIDSLCVCIPAWAFRRLPN
jgi:hypothetical protein